MRVLTIASGGMDSATLLYHLVDQGHAVEALGFDYGQRHKCELRYLLRLCSHANIPAVCADLTTVGRLIQGESSQLNPNVDVPEGHYTDENMKQTVVPNRNMIMLSVAIGRAIAKGFDAVTYGAHAGDHAIYPDCRPEFASAMQTAALLCDWKPVQLLRPFLDYTKAEIAKRGHDLGVPFEQTWTCYKGLSKHCGKCGSCTERIEAFQLAGIDDPTEYAA